MLIWRSKSLSACILKAFHATSQQESLLARSLRELLNRHHILRTRSISNMQQTPPCINRNKVAAVYDIA